MSAIFTVSYRLATEPGNGMFMIGFTSNGSGTWLLQSFLPKFTLALGIGLLLVKRAQRRGEVMA